MKIQSFPFLLLAFAFLCESPLSNATDHKGGKKNLIHKSRRQLTEKRTEKGTEKGTESTAKQKRFNGIQLLGLSGQPGQANIVQTSWSTSYGGNSSSSPQMSVVYNPSGSFQNSFSTGAQVHSETITPEFLLKQFGGQIPQGSWSVSVNSVGNSGNAGGSLANINSQTQTGLGLNSTIQNLIQNFVLQHQESGANSQASQGLWAVLMNSSNIPIGDIPLQSGLNQNYTIQKIIDSFNLANKENGANAQLSQGAWVVLMNSSNVPLGQNQFPTGIIKNYTTISFVTVPTIQVSVPASTLTTQITTMIQQTLIPYLQKYLSPVKSETTGTRMDILMVFLPKLVQLTNDLSNLRNQLSISSTSSLQVPDAFTSQLTNVLIGLQSSVNNLQEAAKTPDDGSNHLPKTFLKPLSNIQQNINQLQPVLQAIKPSQSPVPQVGNSNPLHPNSNVEANGKGPGPQVVPSINEGNWNPLHPNSNVEANGKGPGPQPVPSVNEGNSNPFHLNPNVEANGKGPGLQAVPSINEGNWNPLHPNSNVEANGKGPGPQTIPWVNKGNSNPLHPNPNVEANGKGPEPQAVPSINEENSNPIHPNPNVEANGKGPGPQAVPSINEGNSNPIHPNPNVETNGKGPGPQAVPSVNEGNSSPLHPNPNVEANRKNNPTPVTKAVDELNRLADHIPVMGSGSEPLTDAVTTAEKLDVELSTLRNLATTGKEYKPKDQEKDIQRAILKVTLNMSVLKKGPLQASSDSPKYSNVSVLKFSTHSTQMVLSLVNLFQVYFRDNFPTGNFEGQALSTAVVELLSNTATNLQLLLPYVRDLSGKNDGKAQDDVDHAFNNVFASLPVLLRYLETFTSEVSSGARNHDQPKDLLPTVTKVILNFELTYPFYANIVRHRAEESPQLLKTNRELYVIALSFLAQLHNVSLATTKFHQTVWINIVPQFSNFVNVIVRFDLTQLKGSPGSTDLSADLQLLLTDVRKISDTKSPSSVVALNVIFALLRPQLERLSQTLNAKTMRASFSSIKFTKESTAFLTQFSNMFKNLDLLLTYLDVNHSQKSASADFFLFTIADFRLWFSQAHQIVLDAHKNIPVEVVQVAPPTRKPPRNSGWISFRQQPNLEAHSDEKVSSKLEDDSLLDEIV